jgi:hypothetical protein
VPVLFVALGAVGMSACTSVPASGLQTMAVALTGVGAKAPAATPGVRFMRVRLDRAESFLVFGDVDVSPWGPVEVWYSAGRQVLRLHNGRVFTSAGMPVDWSATDWAASPPAWSAVRSEPVAYLRVRDEYPGLRMGVRERVTIRRVAPPSGLALPGVAEQRWRAWAWYSETAVPDDAAPGGQLLPPALFGVDLKAPGEPVRYSRQCLAPGVCLELQPLGEPAHGL